MKESSPSGIQSERTGTVAKVVFSIVIIALAIYLIYVFNMVGKTGVIVGACLAGKPAICLIIRNHLILKTKTS